VNGTIKRRLDAYERLMRLDKPIGALLLLWPALWGLWLAAYGLPDFDNLAIFIVGVIVMRSFGCVVNDYADRGFDPHVKRTQNRPLAAGEVSAREAIVLAGFLLLIAFLLVLQLNRLTVILAFIALPLAVIYPFLKRVFSFPQAWLGIAFGFSIPMAFAAQHGSLMTVAWVLMIANMFWAIAYDTEYAMVDRDDDVKLGLKSSAILLGRHDVRGVMVAHALFLLVMAGVGFERQLGAPYFAGLLVAAGLAGYQYWLIRGRGREGCFKAFLNNNWLGFAIFAGLALDLYVRVRLRW